jgi:hypothetical protein
MKLLLILLPILLTGCLTTSPKFPEAPSELKTGCASLVNVEIGTAEMSKILDTVVINYSEYHVCKSKVDAWIEWHAVQKKIHDSAIR